MRPNGSSISHRLRIVFWSLGLMLALGGSGLGAIAQSDAVIADGSPSAQVDPTEPPVGESAPLSLVTPVELIVDTTSTGADPCTSIDPAWASIRIDPLTDRSWASADSLAGGNVFLDTTTDPDSFSWDSLGGGTVGGAIVPDAIGDPATDAHFYDYRPFGGSVSGDAGLVAPGGGLPIVLLCLVVPPPASTEIPTEIPTEIAPAPSSATAVETAPAPSETATSDDVVVQPAAIGTGSTVRISDFLNLRTSPSLTAGVVAVLAAGDMATVIGGPQSAAGYIWWQLSTQSGTGWSVSTYLVEVPAANTSTPTATRTPSRTPSRTATPIASAIPSPIEIGSTVRVKQRLNLREAAGTAAAVVAVMEAGTVGTVLAGPQSANGMNWWRISTSVGTGWAAASYLASMPGSSTATPTRTQTTAAPTVTPTRTSTLVATVTRPSGDLAIGDLVRTTARVNLRAAPGTQAAVIVVLPSGSQGTVAGGPAVANNLTWWQLQTTAGTGWVAAPYLARIGVAPTSTSTSTASVSPSASSTRTVGPTRTPTRTPTQTLTPSIVPTVGKCGSLGYGDIARTTDSVNMRSTASTSGTILRTLAAGEQGTVRGGPATANGYTWCQLQIGSTTGWVANLYLVRVSGPQPTPNGTVTPRPSPPDEPSNGSALVIYRGSSSSGKIALTFDCGAERGKAAYILDVLAQYGAKATFGMTGLWAQANPDLVARMVQEGHQLVNHTWDHPSFTGGSSSTTVLTRSARLGQLNRAEAIVEQQTGYQMQPYWRPPYGDIDQSVLRDAYAGGYYVTVMWSCDTLGWNGMTEQQILDRCMYPMGAGDIILMHVGSDGLDWAAADNMIRYFQSEGLQLVTVEELLNS